MPEVLLKFLENLDSKDAESIWEWLDSNEEAVQDMIEVVASSH